MKLNLEQYLYPIDQSFSNKKPNEVYMIYGLIIGILFAFSYFLFWDSAEEEYKRVNQARLAVEKKLEADEQYLAMHPESEIAQLDNDIVNIKKATVAAKEKNEYINYRISQISELFYNEKAWGKYLDSIAENAKKYKIKLAMLSNKRAQDKEKFGHVLDINVVASGSYANMIKFINAMEQSELVIDLHDLDLSAEQTLNVDINSSVWGITY
jgi:outer membrane murein-binding lipoprotein Lpp